MRFGVCAQFVLACAVVMVAACDDDRAERENRIDFELSEPSGLRPIRRLLGVNGPAEHVRMERDSIVLGEIGPLGSMGVTSVRTHDFFTSIDLSEIFPVFTADPTNDDNYDWLASDLTYQDILATTNTILGGQLRPYLRIGESTPLSGTITPSPGGTSAAAVWEHVPRQILRHFHVDLPEAMGEPSALGHVEFWNQPDQERYWYYGGGVSGYVGKLAQFVTHVNATYPELQVGGGSFSTDAATSSWVDDFITQYLDLARASGDTEPFHINFLSWQMHSSNTVDFMTAAERYRERIEILELGLSTQIQSHLTSWTVAPEDMHLLTELEGTSLATTIWMTLQDAPIDLAHFYRGVDYPGVEEPQAGLFYPTAGRKAAGHAFQLWAEFAGNEARRLDITASPVGKPDLWRIARRDESGQHALLLANRTEETLTWTVRLADASSPIAHDEKMTIKKLVSTGAIPPTEIREMDGTTDGHDSIGPNEVVLVLFN